MIVKTRKQVFNRICPLCDHELSNHVVSCTSKDPNLLRIQCTGILHHSLKCRCNAGFESKVILEAEMTIQTLEEKARRLNPKRYIK